MSIKNKISRRVITLFVFCALTVAAVITFVIIPMAYTNKTLTEKITPLKNKVEYQSQLLPVYLELQKALTECNDIKNMKLLIQEGDQVSEINDDIQAFADSSKVTYTLSSPSLKKRDEFKLLVVTINVSGTFKGCGDFINQTARLPYVSGIEAIDINRKNGLSSCTVKFQIAVKS